MNGSLYLIPQSLSASPQVDSCLQVLRELQIIAAPIDTGDDWQSFWAGEDFARHVVFAGCSPYLRLQPEHPQDRQFCHVAVHGPFPTPLLVTGSHAGKPRCPACRTRLTDWQERAANPKAMPCSSCGEPLSACQLDWRQGAACGRVLIELRNVFHGEATPSDQLISSLRKATGLDWHYAWADMRLN